MARRRGGCILQAGRRAAGRRCAWRSAGRADYDGVLAAYAAWDQIELDLQFIRVSQALYARGGFLPRSKTRLIAHAVLQACDAQDGVKDGIISNPAGCRFDAAALRCADGKTGHGCLSDGQMHTLETFATAQVTAFPLANGEAEIPGFNVLAGADLTGSLGLLHHPMRNPVILFNAFYYVVGDGVLRYFLTGDPHYDALRFDVRTGGKWRDGLLPQSLRTDSSNADLSAFAGHGGKLLLVHGTTDMTIPTNSSVAYYEKLKATMGVGAVDGFARLYIVPGFGHGKGSVRRGVRYGGGGAGCLGGQGRGAGGVDGGGQPRQWAAVASTVRPTRRGQSM